jgi:hypothetical protein
MLSENRLGRGDYPWKRFWCPRGGSFRVDRDGFLLDPEEEFGSITNPDAKPFDALTGAHFLGLLGEAGSGKTRTLRSEYSGAAGPIAETGDLSRLVSLRDIGSGTDLGREIFDSDWFREWRKGERQLHLFLDALDEASDFYPQVAARLLKCLSDLPLQRLFVRVTCRTASWPRIFDSELRASLKKVGLGAEPYAVYELLPLRRKDVELAGASEGLDPNDFVEEVVRKGAVALASKPLTLEFLVTSYKGTKALPLSSVDLYTVGCRNLVSESSDARRDARATGNLDAGQRQAIAERLAAITLFGNRQAIWMGLAGERPPNDASPEDVRGVELFDGRKLEVSDSETVEVIGTAQFSSRGENRFGWSHQTFGEFLAARYLARHELTTSQILSLISTPDDAPPTVRPQLGGVAAWLASMREDIQRALLEKDPAVLLLSDSTTLSSEVRCRLVSGLLEKFERAELADRESTLFRLYAKLAYPGMAQQVREVISEPALGTVAKREAIAMARACKLTELSGFLADLALNGAAPIQLRTSAAITVADTGDSASRRSLLPLTAGLPEDIEDEVKGAALHALWPGVLEVQEILPCLTRRKQPNHYGLYEFFLLGLPEEASDQDVALLLRWISGLDQSYSMSHSFGGMASRILDRAWSIADAPEVMAELPHALRNANRLHFERSKANWLEPASRRRALITQLVQSFGSREEALKDWPNNLGIPTASDFEWLLAQFQGSSAKHQPIWLELLTRVFSLDDAKQTDAILEAASISTSLATEFGWCLGSVDLSSARAEQAREAQREREKWKKLRESRRKDGRAELDKLLDLAERGELEAWCRIPWALSIDSDGNEPGGLPPTDLVTKPGWLAADLSTRGRIMRAGTNFVKDYDPKTSEWLHRNTWSSDVISGLSAFSILNCERPDLLSALLAETWKRWAPALVSYPFFGDGDQTAAALRLAAYANAPSVVLETIATAIDADDVFATQYVDSFWDDRLANLLLTKLRGPGLKDGTFSSLLRKLLEHSNHEACQVARDLVTGPPPSDPTARSKAISTGVSLLSNDPETTWPLVRPSLSTDEAFAREFFVGLARDGRPDHDRLFEGLGGQEAADLYIRLSELFPHSRDRRITGAVGPGDEGRMFRESLLAWLQNRGTQEACDAIASIARRMPHLSGLKWVLFEANQARRRNAPGWPQPSEILALATDRSKRLVRDENELMEVLIEMLARLETDLHGETPAVRFLWDKVRDRPPAYRPKEEDALSNYVKIFLDRELADRGVITNREVQIKRRFKTDLHVDAVRKTELGGHERVTVIIEAKGSWNRELLTAMKTQLVGKYLTDNQCRYGVYLVFWFDCDSWDRRDSRWRARARFDSMDALKSILAAQAAELPGFSVRPLVLDARLTR